jgi:NAD(P)-dependent dehydrogenase (short-subunit alcohol dehydrogenase family)
MVSRPETHAVATMFDQAFGINLKGPWLALRAAIAMLRPGGAVALNGSINAHLGMAEPYRAK